MTKDQALLLIEKIVLLNDPAEESKPLSDIYMIAHAFRANEVCIHPDWQRKAEELWEQLKNV